MQLSSAGLGPEREPGKGESRRQGKRKIWIAELNRLAPVTGSISRPFLKYKRTCRESGWYPWRENRFLFNRPHRAERNGNEKGNLLYHYPNILSQR